MTDNGDNQHETSFELVDNGAVWALESHYHRNRFAREALPGVFKLGGYYMTGDFRHIGVAYGTYTFFAALSFFFVWALVKETKGKELEEM